jgi:hypothetical protein
MSEPRHRIILFYLPDGRYVEYQGLAHLVSNLLELHEVAAICAYRGNSPSLLRMGLFENPSFLVHRICTIYKCIRLHDPEQAEDIQKFFLWLLEHFLPFLTHSERFIADVRSQVDGNLLKSHVPPLIGVILQLRDHFNAGDLSQVDSYLSERQFPPLAKIISTLRNQFSVVPKRFLCCIVLTLTHPIPRGRYQSEISRNPNLTASAIAHLNWSSYEASHRILRVLVFYQTNLTRNLMNLSHLPRIRGKSFWRKVQVITIAVNFLIRKSPKSWWSHIIMRVLSGL